MTAPADQSGAPTTTRGRVGQRHRDHRHRAGRGRGRLLLGACIEIAQTGAGQITVSGSGVTLRLPSGKQAKTRLQYSIIALTKRNMDEWIFSGDLARGSERRRSAVVEADSEGVAQPMPRAG